MIETTICYVCLTTMLQIFLYSGWWSILRRNCGFAHRTEETSTCRTRKMSYFLGVYLAYLMFLLGLCRAATKWKPRTYPSTLLSTINLISIRINDTWFCWFPQFCIPTNILLPSRTYLHWLFINVNNSIVFYCEFLTTLWNVIIRNYSFCVRILVRLLTSMYCYCFIGGFFLSLLVPARVNTFWDVFIYIDLSMVVVNADIFRNNRHTDLIDVYRFEVVINTWCLPKNTYLWNVHVSINMAAWSSVTLRLCGLLNPPNFIWNKIDSSWFLYGFSNIVCRGHFLW